jgi:hypothetical protein
MFAFQGAGGRSFSQRGNLIGRIVCLCKKQNGPKTINDLKLINAGKILENSKTLADSRVILGEIPGCVITMHVVLRPPTNDKASEKQQSETPKNKTCCCTIL